LLFLILFFKLRAYCTFHRYWDSQAVIYDTLNIVAWSGYWHPLLWQPTHSNSKQHNPLPWQPTHSNSKQHNPLPWQPTHSNSSSGLCCLLLLCVGCHSSCSCSCSLLYCGPCLYFLLFSIYLQRLSILMQTTLSSFHW
jgi:hypothetical protein